MIQVKQLIVVSHHRNLVQNGGWFAQLGGYWNTISNANIRRKHFEKSHFFLVPNEQRFTFGNSHGTTSKRLDFVQLITRVMSRNCSNFLPRNLSILASSRDIDVFHIQKFHVFLVKVLHCIRLGVKFSINPSSDFGVNWLAVFVNQNNGRLPGYRFNRSVNQAHATTHGVEKEFGSSESGNVRVFHETACLG